MPLRSEAPLIPIGCEKGWTDRSAREEGTVTPLRVPESADGHGVTSERVVEVGRGTPEVKATKTSNLLLGIQGTSPWKPREKCDRLLDLIGKDLDGEVILDPPDLGSPELVTRDFRENNLPTPHAERNSRRISLASLMRPASTSAPEAARARCSAERSSSSSQSPGSKGRSSTSVPSGRSVGSSTTKRPLRTVAFSVMSDKVLAKAPSAKLRPAGGTGVPSNQTMNLSR